MGNIENGMFLIIFNWCICILDILRSYIDIIGFKEGKIIYF